jgi:hypothetical protein
MKQGKSWTNRDIDILGSGLADFCNDLFGSRIVELEALPALALDELCAETSEITSAFLEGRTVVNELGPPMRSEPLECEPRTCLVSIVMVAAKGGAACPPQAAF